MASSPQRIRLHGVQLLRAIAASLVAVFHAHVELSRQAVGGQDAFEGYLFAFGASGVHIFFVISGLIMVVTTPMGDRYQPQDFYRRRLTRIYPIYWIFAGLYLAIFPLLGKPYTLSLSGLAGGLLLLPGQAAAIVGPGWTLAFELYFYLCFGLAMLLGLNRGLIVLTLGFVGSIVLGIRLHPSGPLFKHICDPILVEFLAGTWIGWLAVKGWLPRRSAPLIVALGVAIFGAGIVFGYDRIPLTVAWGLPSILVVLGVVAWERHAGSGQFVRRFGVLGDSSYALYLAHTLIVAIMIAGIGYVAGAMPSSIGLAAFAIMLVAIVVSHAVHLAVEKPLMRLLAPRRRVAAAAAEATV